MDDGSTSLNVGLWQERSAVNGPGERFVVWLQGCQMRCAGCINPEFQPQVTAHLITVGEMASRVIAVSGIEGVTYTGGEPTLQAPALSLLSDRLHAAGLSVISYTGYTLEDLLSRNDSSIRRFLAGLDLLIDGSYDPDKAANLLWRGSSNQRVLFLSDLYRDWESKTSKENAQVEMTLHDGELTATGIWPAEFLDRLRKRLGG